jgi:hypothetical protein
MRARAFVLAAAIALAAAAGSAVPARADIPAITFGGGGGSITPQCFWDGESFDVGETVWLVDADTGDTVGFGECGSTGGWAFFLF